MTGSPTGRFRRAVAIGLGTLALVVLPWSTVVGALGTAPPPAGLRLVESSTARVVLELNLPDYTIRQQEIDGATYTAPSVADLGLAGVPGQPQLPVQGALVGIPPGARATLRILVVESRRDHIPYPPVPAPAARSEMDPTRTLLPEPKPFLQPDAAFYAAGRIHPAKPARISSTGNWRSQRFLGVEFHPLQYDAAARQLIFHRRLRVEVAFSYPPGVSDHSPSGPVDEGLFEPVLRKALVNYEAARGWRTKAKGIAPLAETGSSLDAALPWYKIALDADGMYQITCAELSAAGIDPGSLDPRTLKVYKDGSELAIDAVGQADGLCDDGDYVVFFGQAARTRYTDTNIYWLTHGGAAGRRMERRDGSGAASVASTFTNTVHIERDLLYRPYFPMEEGSDHWYWNYLSSDSTADYTFAITALAAAPVSATLETKLYGFGGNHRTLAYINGNLVDDTSWSGSGERRATITFPQAYLSDGPNTIRLRELGPSGSLVFANSFDVTYASSFQAIGDTLRFRQPPGGPWQYQIGGFDEPSVEAFDVSDPFDVGRLIDTAVSSPCPCTLEFTDGAAGAGEYLALAPAQRKSPLRITRDTPSNLRGTTNGADYIVVAYGGFVPNVEPLASYRASQGMRVTVVDVQDVYDEFSDGLVDAQAIRDFLAYAYQSWQAPAPSFALLVGDGHFDFKDNMGVAEGNYIPPYLRMVDPWLGETASDSRLVAFEDGAGNTLPQMAIGRLPAASAAEVDAMVNKILSYEQSPPEGDWRTRIGFATDGAYSPGGAADTAGNFWLLSDGLASDTRYITGTFTAERVYYNPCASSVHPQCALPYTPYASAAEARGGIVAAINDGRVIVNYVGHSSITSWGKDQIFRAASELGSLANGGKTPVMIAMTCYDGYFHFPGTPGLAEANLRLAGRGALASWSAAGLGVATGHDYLDRGFFAAVMQQNVAQIGPATILGKANLWTNSGGAYRDLIDTFNLLGDPASRLAIPSPPVPEPEPDPEPAPEPEPEPGVSSWLVYFPLMRR